MKIPLVILILAAATSHGFSQLPDIVLADFEGANYGAWKTTGSAFGNGPSPGAIDGQRPVDGFHGKGLANSFHGADRSTGTLTSPEFKIQRKFITFLIGGGGLANKTCVNLLVAGKSVRTAVGDGSEKLGGTAWDVRDLAGQTAQIQVVDEATGGMGHVMVDQIVMTDRAGQPIANASRDFIASKRYLNIPLKYDGDRRQVTILVDDKPLSSTTVLNMKLADGKPDWWAYYDISKMRGKKVTFRVNKLAEDSMALRSIEQADEIKDESGIYDLPTRPQLYFSHKRGGSGDANGLFYYDGEYHIFFQHNPFGPGGGENSHWGHAVSKNLMNWEQLPVALAPDDDGWCYSGSAAVDWNNTLGMQTGKEKTLLLAYTGTARGQCIYYSTNRGRNWLRYPGNPVLPIVESGSRDPKLFWHEPTKKWVMVICYGQLSQGTNPNYGIYNSSDLKTWNRTSTFFVGTETDCPELFEIAVDGDPANKKWIFYGGAANYIIGSFDGKTFTQETSTIRLFWGGGYASQTFNDMPDGRRVLVANCHGGGGTSGFWGAISLPVELTLRSTSKGPRLYTYPVKEIEQLRVATKDIPAQPLKAGVNPLADIQGELLDVVADVEVGNATQISLNLRGMQFTYDSANQQLNAQGVKVPMVPVNGRIRLRACVDRLTTFVFPSDGEYYIALGSTPSPSNLSLSLSEQGTGAKIHSLQVHQLKSIWK